MNVTRGHPSTWDDNAYCLHMNGHTSSQLMEALRFKAQHHERAAKSCKAPAVKRRHEQTAVDLHEVRNALILA